MVTAVLFFFFLIKYAKKVFQEFEAPTYMLSIKDIQP